MADGDAGAGVDVAHGIGFIWTEATKSPTEQQ